MAVSEEESLVAPSEKLTYTIYDVSSFSGEFSPRHILVDKPTDQKSRWLSDGNKPPQFVTLKLEKPAIVRKILFGKYERSHPCNIQKLRVYGGLNPDHTHLILEGNLKNDGVPEMLDLTCSVDGRPFPCQFIKVVPLQSWGGSFNLSIWHVQLCGISEEVQVEEALSNLMQFREREALRLCLKHLRQYDYSEAFEALQKKCKILLEHPLLTKLHHALVTEGDFEEAENIICQVMEEGFFDGYISKQPVKAKWTLIPYLKDDDDVTSVPSTSLDMRGGHQMCIDSEAGKMYLYGGWDGSRELGDLWQFSNKDHTWKCLSPNTLQEDGPGARSCHAMCFDPQQNGLYVLGGYLNREHVSELLDCSPSKLYFYSVEKKKWYLLSSDTHEDGGPRLLYDHQMCYDSRSGLLYVLGGRVVSTDICSGLYTYLTVEHHWLCLSPDQPPGSISIQKPYLPRSGHIMLLHPELHKLYVLGGQRQQEFLGDMLTYDVRSGETSALADGEVRRIPVVGFTLCASLDTAKDVICVLTGLSRLEDREPKGSNSLWFYNIQSDQWSEVVRSDGVPLCHSPVPRYAHSFVYDSLHSVFYMFGGNPGSESAHTKATSTMRLDDFWKLELLSESKEKLLKECQLRLRKQRYLELSSTDSVVAVAYLQSSVAAIVDHNDEDESRQYRELTGVLFSSDVHCSNNAVVSPKRMRSELYDELAVYFPEDMSQPKDNLTDFIKLNH